MRVLAASLVSVLALSACNPGAPGGSAGGGASGAFPDLSQASYRLEATVTDPDSGETTPMVMIRDGAKMRIESSNEGSPTAIIVNPETGQTYMVTQNEGQTVAMLVSATDFQNPAAEWQAEMANATRVGACSGAGLNGTEWSRTDEAGEVSNLCITDDGIFLRAVENGVTTWETTSVSRGAQDAALFAPPPGAQIFDPQAAMRDAMQSGGQ